MGLAHLCTPDPDEGCLGHNARHGEGIPIPKCNLARSDQFLFYGQQPGELNDQRCYSFGGTVCLLVQVPWLHIRATTRFFGFLLPHIRGWGR